jgi:hypothetical protein
MIFCKWNNKVCNCSSLEEIRFKGKDRLKWHKKNAKTSKYTNVFIGFDQICSVDPEQYINLNTGQFHFLLAE